MFGDSHAFGHGIDEKHFFANLNRRLRIKSFGVSGYSMVQPLLWMRELAHHLENKLVLWLVFLGNDLADNLEPAQYHYRMPFVRETNDRSKWEIGKKHIESKT